MRTGPRAPGGSPSDGAADGGVELFWIPLGAGAHVARWSGRVYEAFAARWQHRTPCDLYHAALVITVADGRFTVEQTPVPDRYGERRGVVASGPVGLRCLGRFRVFRYEVRCWRDGVIPDVAAAVASPVRVTDDPTLARRVLDVLPSIPVPVWGRDELRAGEMWNSNSVVAWALTRSGIDTTAIPLPERGRAPGWDAGRVVAGRPRLSGPR